MQQVSVGAAQAAAWVWAVLESVRCEAVSLVTAGSCGTPNESWSTLIGLASTPIACVVTSRPAVRAETSGPVVASKPPACGACMRGTSHQVLRANGQLQGQPLSERGLPYIRPRLCSQGFWHLNAVSSVNRPPFRSLNLHHGDMILLPEGTPHV